MNQQFRLFSARRIVSLPTSLCSFQGAVDIKCRSFRCGINMPNLLPALTGLIDGGDDRARTGDLLRARQALSQLSYTPAFGNYKC